MKTIEQKLDTAGEYRVSEIRAASRSEKRRLAQHHLDIMSSDIASELYRWDELKAECDQLKATSKLPRMGGRLLYQYINNNDNMIWPVRRSKAEVEALRQTWRPSVADALNLAVENYIRAIQKIRDQYPYPSDKRAKIEWHKPIINSVAIALSNLFESVQQLKRIESPMKLIEGVS